MKDRTVGSIPPREGKTRWISKSGARNFGKNDFQSILPDLIQAYGTAALERFQLLVSAISCSASSADSRAAIIPPTTHRLNMSRITHQWKWVRFAGPLEPAS
jgi:hypothetical protein